MIELKVTDELVSLVREHSEVDDPAMIQAVLDVVERDLNAAMVLIGQLNAMAARSGCASIEVGDH